MKHQNFGVLPSLLTAERRDVEVAPGGPHRLVAAAVNEVCAEQPVAVARRSLRKLAPVLVIGTSVIVGFDAAKIDVALRSLLS